MKIFIWNYVSKCSSHYHSGGGVAVVAEDEQKARTLANREDGCSISIDEKPDLILDVIDGKEKVFIFPDAGCC